MNKASAKKWLGLAAGILLFAQAHVVSILPETIRTVVEVVGAGILAANGALVKKTDS